MGLEQDIAQLVNKFLEAIATKKDNCSLAVRIYQGASGVGLQLWIIPTRVPFELLSETALPTKNFLYLRRIDIPIENFAQAIATGLSQRLGFKLSQIVPTKIKEHAGRAIMEHDAWFFALEEPTLQA